MSSNIPYGHAVHEYYVRLVRTVYRERQARLKAIVTAADAAEYVRTVREKIISLFGPMPEKTPLNPQVIDTILTGNIRIEKIIFHSRPNFPVPALLYLPRQCPEKLPAILGVCGHSEDGKAAEPYQLFCQSLAVMGYAVLIYDPISQGERLQFLSEPDNDISGSCTREHNVLGKNLLLEGEFFGAWRAWDGIRALDYLLSRPEIDTSRVGVTGNSGGGTLTAYLNVLDDRITMTAPSCFITTYLRNLENELPTDSEQIPPDILKYGGEMSDFIIARAPRPTIVIGQKDDFFDYRGTVEAYQDAEKIYRLLGAEDNLRIFLGRENHGYHKTGREAMYRFFHRHAGISGEIHEPPGVFPFSAKDLRCTPQGQVDDLPDIRKVTDFIREKGLLLLQQRLPADGKKLVSALTALLNLPSRPPDAPPFRVLRRRLEEKAAGKIISRFALETEAGIPCIMSFKSARDWHHLPEGKNAILYLPHLAAEADYQDDFCPESTADENVFAFETRGIGETRPLTCCCSDYFNYYGADYFYAAYAMMLGEPYLGGKVRDVLAAAALLHTTGYRNIHLYGRGLGTFPAAFAALLSDNVNRVTLRHYLESYHLLTQTALNLWPQSHLIPGALTYFDLPDVYRELAAKNLTVIEPWDAQMRRME